MCVLVVLLRSSFIRFKITYGSYNSRQIYFISSHLKLCIGDCLCSTLIYTLCVCLLLFSLSFSHQRGYSTCSVYIPTQQQQQWCVRSPFHVALWFRILNNVRQANCQSSHDIHKCRTELQIAMCVCAIYGQKAEKFHKRKENWKKLPWPRQNKECRSIYSNLSSECRLPISHVRRLLKSKWEFLISVVIRQRLLSSSWML